MALTDLIEKDIQSPDFKSWYNDTYVAPAKSRNASIYANYIKQKKIQELGKLGDKMDQDNLIADVDKYIKYAKDDYITGLAKSDMNLADALQEATESYGAGNLIGSGIQGARTTEMINDADMGKDDLKENKIRTIDKYNTEKQRAIDKYNQITTPLNDMRDKEIRYKPVSPIGEREAMSGVLNRVM